MTGLPACAVLLANNVRDVSTDVVAGKRTLAVRIGEGRARQLFVACLVGAFVAEHYGLRAALYASALGILVALYGAVHFFFPTLFPGALILLLVILLLGVRVGSDEDVYGELERGEAPAYEDSKLATREQAGLLADEAALTAWLKAFVAGQA